MILEIQYSAKCKHCAHFEQGMRKVKSKCVKNDPSNAHPNGGTVTAKALACDNFKL